MRQAWRAAVSADIRIELQRGATAVTVTWPASAASECAAWLLRHRLFPVQRINRVSILFASTNALAYQPKKTPAGKSRAVVKAPRLTMRLPSGVKRMARIASMEYRFCSVA